MSLLHQAAERGDYSTLRSLLRKDSSGVNSPNPAGFTPLFLAVVKGSIPCYNLLIRYGADPYADESTGCVSIDEAFDLISDSSTKRYVCASVGRHLINSNNVNDLVGTTSYLMIASRYRDGRFVKWLLRTGADLNISNMYGTALHHACSIDRNVTVIKILLQAGAKIEEKAGDLNLTPLANAVASGANRNIVYLVNTLNADKNVKLNEEKSLTHLATEYNRPSTLELLLALNLATDSRSVHGDHILHTACQNNSVECLKRMLDIRKNKQHLAIPINNRGYAPMHIAAEYGHIECMKVLLEAGASVDFQNPRNKITPLHMAASANQLEMVKFLLSAGADKFSLDGKGSIPWCFAPTGSEVEKILPKFQTYPKA